MQGCLVENGSDEEIDLMERWEFEAYYTYTRANTMPWWGQIENREGYMAIINTPFDAGVDFYHKKGGCSRKRISVDQSVDLAYWFYSVSFADACGYTGGKYLARYGNYNRSLPDCRKNCK